MKIIIVGAGETGINTANLLGGEFEVAIIEKDDELAKKVAQKTNALVLHGDGGDISILKEAGIENAFAVIAVTGDDKTNLMVSMIAKSENVPRIIPLVHNPKDEELFIKLGITHIVSHVTTNVTGIRKMLYTFGEARIIAQLGGGEVQIIEQVISDKSPLIRRKAEIPDAVIATIYRKGELIIPTDKTIIELGDVVLFAVKTMHIRQVAGFIRGE